MDPEDSRHQKLCSLKGGKELGQSYEVQCLGETVHNGHGFRVSL